MQLMILLSLLNVIVIAGGIKSVRVVSLELKNESEYICDFASGINLFESKVQGWDCNQSSPFLSICNDSLSSWDGVHCNSNSIEGINLDGYKLSGTISKSIGYIFSLKYLFLDNNLIVGTIPSNIGLLDNLLQLTLSNNLISGTIPTSLALLSSLENLNLATNSMSGTLLSSIENLSNLYSLKLPYNYLSGTIPSSIGHLTLLTFFEFQNNLLTGTIPSAIGFLSQLIRLQFFSNYLSGTIPTSVGYMHKLTRLTLYDNELTGTIPTIVGQLSQMSTFYLFSNSLTGTIPSVIGILSQMYRLALFGNKLTGTIPSILGNLTKLYLFYVNENNLIGSIPSSFGKLSNMLYFLTYTNKLTGSIPSSIGNMKSLNVINFSVNKISGILPSTLGYLTDLSEFYLNVNKLTGTIPSELGNLINLEVFDFTSNSLTGSTPDWFWENRMLGGIIIDFNFLSGTLPSKIGLATQLSNIHINGNRFTGTIPTAIGNLTNLVVITITGGSLTGTIPSEIGKMSSLTSLQFFSNKLTGTLPSTVFARTTLGNIYLYSNKLTGTIPTVIARNIAVLNSLNLNDNALAGTIPEHIGNCSTLYELDLSNNKFTGTLPTSLGKITKLQYLYVSGNKLTGSLPTSIINWTKLKVLEVNSNKFTGTIPSALTASSTLHEVYLRGNQFEGSIAHIFNISFQKHIRNIDISDNYLSGTIPSSWFSSSILQIFSAASNCITMSDLEYFCKADNLVVLSLDGLETAANCRNYFFKYSSRNTYSLEHITKKNIPSCLYALSQLTLLHLSGNGLTGTIPSDVILGNSLTNLALSYNRLQGPIPENIQRRNWTTLDLSFNSFSGTLSESIPTVTPKNSKLSVNINRLSGDIPHSLLHRSYASIVQGNIFQCNFNSDKLPTGDSDSSSYNCGSDAFYLALYVFFGSLLVNAIALKIIIYFKGIPAMFRFKQPNKSIALIKVMLKMISLTVAMTIFILCVMMPVFGALSHYYGTHSYEYALSVSAGLVSGNNARVIMLVVWSGMLLFFAVMYKSIFKSMSTSQIIIPEAMITTEIDANPRGLLWDNVVLSVLLLVDMGVVFAANAAYITATLQGDIYTVVFLQFILGVFKVVWRYFYIENIGYFRDCITGHTHRNKQELLFLTLILIMNNVVLPVFSEAVIDSNCIYNIFVSAEPVKSSYGYEVCQSELNPTTDLCYTNSALTVDISYTPPFIYRYQCCATIIRNYVSVYTYMFVLTALQMPISSFMRWLRNKCPKNSLRRRLSGIGVHQLHNDTPRLNYPLYVAGLISNLAILVTFGAAFPPLALIILIAMLLDAMYVSNVLPVEVVPVPINDLGLTIYLVPFSALFFSFFLFDVTDYQDDSWSSLWAPMTIILIPLFYYSIHRLVVLISSKCKSRDNVYQANPQEIEDHQASSNNQKFSDDRNSNSDPLNATSQIVIPPADIFNFEEEEVAMREIRIIDENNINNNIDMMGGNEVAIDNHLINIASDDDIESKMKDNDNNSNNNNNNNNNNDTITLMI